MDVPVGLRLAWIQDIETGPTRYVRPSQETSSSGPGLHTGASDMIRTSTIPPFRVVDSAPVACAYLRTTA